MTTWTQILIQQRLFGRRAATTSSYGGVIVGFVAEIFRVGYGWNGARFGSVVVTCKHSSTSEIFADIIYQHYTPTIMSIIIIVSLSLLYYTYNKYHVS